MNRANVLTEQQHVPPLQVNDNKYLARQEHCLTHNNTASTTDDAQMVLNNTFKKN